MHSISHKISIKTDPHSFNEPVPRHEPRPIRYESRRNDWVSQELNLELISQEFKTFQL